MSHFAYFWPIPSDQSMRLIRQHRPKWIIAVIVVISLSSADAGVRAIENVTDEVEQQELEQEANVAKMSVYGWIFGGDFDVVTARERLGQRIAGKIRFFDQLCELTVSQKEKLRLVGAGEVKHIWNRIDKIVSRFQIDKDDHGKIRELRKEAEQIKDELSREPLSEDSMWIKTMKSILNPGQFSRFEPLRLVLQSGGRVELRSRDKPEQTFLYVALTSESGLDQLHALPSLFGVILRGPNVTESALVHLSNLSALKELSFAEVPVTDSGLNHLKKLTGLKKFSLYKSEVTGAGLSSISRCNQMNFLLLKDSPVTDEGMLHLKGMTSLSQLWLTNTLVSDGGVASLSELVNLQILYLNKTQVTDIGLTHLKGMQNLNTLLLSDTAVTDAGLKHLQGLTGLKTLALTNTKVTDVGISDLKRALPGLTIHR